MLAADLKPGDVVLHGVARAEVLGVQHNADGTVKLKIKLGGLVGEESLPASESVHRVKPRPSWDELLESLPDPDLVGDTVYRAVHEAIFDADFGGEDPLECAVALCDAFEACAKDVAERLHRGFDHGE